MAPLSLPGPSLAPTEFSSGASGSRKIIPQTVNTSEGQRAKKKKKPGKAEHLGDSMEGGGNPDLESGILKLPKPPSLAVPVCTIGSYYYLAETDASNEATCRKASLC